MQKERYKILTNTLHSHASSVYHILDCSIIMSRVHGEFIVYVILIEVCYTVSWNQRRRVSFFQLVYSHIAMQCAKRKEKKKQTCNSLVEYDLL